MILQKWNYEKHEYEPYKVPDEWKCKVYTDNMDELVNCPHCGKELRFGDTYTSLEIHTERTAFGFGVCTECYEKEWLRRREAREQDK